MFGLHNCVITFFLIYPCMLCHLMLKKKICKDHVKQKESKCFQYGCKCVSRRCESYMMYLEGDSLHQTVMIVCECIWSSYIITLHIMIYLCSLAKFHTHHTLCFSWYCCTSTMWFGHHKEYMWWYVLSKLSKHVFEIKLVRLV